ncbi:putative E3 ubiquitin-protein ligase RING1a [Zingiber officinale]|uniref:putative E3 ubiquitin-protein ligase RING1a n=1 Tax=Zingiber officinale TaxID=94328 RepID=UPI001C4B7A7E|nr:putative E3 ubiquitin-protein ligase RING1a [Zingiber officinale]
MPAPKRPLSPPPVHSIPASDDTPPSAMPLADPPPLLLKHEPDVEDREATAQELRDDFDGRVGGGRSSDEGDEEEEDDDEAEKPEFIFVKLADIRKEVQCPICLGIIRKTRTVMECLHRFCRECIDKSMRLGNNECPACRTHCASRRSLRDDPNYDALIAALYPDIDKYEEEELAFHEEEKSRNKKIQAYIAETFRRQSEALGRRRSSTRANTPFGRKPQGSYQGHLRGRGRNIGNDAAVIGSDEEEETNANDESKDSSSADEPSPDRKPKRCKRWGAPPARTAGSVDMAEENEDFEINREPLGTLPLRAGNREMLAWGKNGTRSQTRHNTSGGSNGRLTKGGRVAKLVDYLRNLEEVDDEFDIHLTLIPLDKESMPNLERQFLSCRPTMSIKHLCQFIALQTSTLLEGVEIYARIPRVETMAMRCARPEGEPSTDPSSVGLERLEGEESLTTLYASFTSDSRELVLVYRLKIES